MTSQFFPQAVKYFSKTENESGLPVPLQLCGMRSWTDCRKLPEHGEGSVPKCERWIPQHERHHISYLSAEEDDPTACLLPGGSVLQEAPCPVPGSWASVPRGASLKHILRQSCSTGILNPYTHTHPSEHPLNASTWLPLWAGNAELWYHHLWRHKLHCIKWGDGGFVRGAELGVR